MVKILKNFISPEEVESLNSWCLKNYTKSFFRDPNMDRYHQRSRLTTRGCGLDNITINYPKESYNIQNKLIKELNIKKPLYPPPFYNGIVNGIGFKNGSIFSHRDPIYFQNTFTLHCNFITKKSIHGGTTIINQKEYDINESDSLVYVVSHQDHEVTPIDGNEPRILWCYGFCISEKELCNIFKS
jgi:hypothetical protein